MSQPQPTAAPTENKFVQGLGLLDSTMIVAGSMIGSGIFIVSADIARQVGSPGWLLVVWLVTGILTVVAALSYGELAAMFPRAGGQYVYLREAYSPLCGFLYGWTLFLVIQTGTIAAVAVAFARFLGVLIPAISPTAWIIPPLNLSSGYAISLSTQQGVAILVVVLLTIINTRGLALGKIIQNVFTSAKTLALVALIAVGILFMRSPEAVHANFGEFWTPRGVAEIRPDFSFMPMVTAAGGLGLLIAICVAQVGSLFSSVAWECVTFTAGEIKEPKRNIPLSLLAGTSLVISLYLLVNLAYLCLLPFAQIQHAPEDRVATAVINTVFGGSGAAIMAAAILVSTFGCNNGLILTGARVYYAMAKDGLFFKATGRLNPSHVPAVGLILQCVWTALLVLPRTRLHDPVTGALKTDPVTGAEQYGNLYGNLLDYVVFAVLIFYVLTIAGVFVLRRKQPDAVRPYRAWGYPVVPALYILVATVISLVLLLYRTQTTWPGLLIVLSGVPVYFLWKRKSASVPAG
ncbi:MAG: amino acid permease [Verrucomicrobia bacterium]|jgi:APA family basic amino acid/polyamine antiporter|nr:amino acid permease [Verrucomicrobiota bacterium]